MGMFPSGNKSKKIFQIENPLLSLEILSDIQISNLNKSYLNNPSTLMVRSKEKNVVKTLNSLGYLTENSGYKMMPVFYENDKCIFILNLKEDYKSLSIKLNGVSLANNFSKVQNLWIGQVEFKGNVGYTDIDIFVNGRSIVSLMIEVFPTKMDYREDYMRMMTELEDEISSITYKLLDKTYLQSIIKNTNFQTSVEFVNILDYIYEEFLKNIKRLCHNLNHNIIKNKKVMKTHAAKKIDLQTRAFLRKKPFLLKPRENGVIKINNAHYYPEKVIETRKSTTVDVFENQMIKFFLKDIIRRIENVEITLKGLDSNFYKLTDEKYNLKNKKNELKFVLNKHFHNISDILPKDHLSLVFQKNLLYRKSYLSYVILTKGLNLGLDLFKVTPKKIYELYEIWCYIKVHRIINQLGYEVENYGIIKSKYDGISLNLNTNSESVMVYKKREQIIRLWYNKYYISPTNSQKPDTVLHIENSDQKKKRMYLFDSKYRLSIDKNGNQSPLEEDINVMHRYRDSIVSKISSNFQYKYDTFGAYVMFPCNDEKLFEKHKFFKSIEQVNIGAFPMLPGNTKLITSHLEKIVSQSNVAAKNSLPLFDPHDSISRYESKNVLIMDIVDSRLLENYIDNSFYHIPKELFYKLKPGIKYIAFYQHSKKNMVGSICFYGEIKDIIEYQLSECSEIKSKSEELYIRFNFSQIKKVSNLSGDIKFSENKFSPKYTTLYLLENALSTDELMIQITE